MDLKKHIRKIISEEINTGGNDIYNNLYFKRRISDFTEENVLNKIYKTMSETDPNDYLDEYDWADNIINWVIDDLMVDVVDPKYDDIVDTIDDYMKTEYAYIMFDYYEDNFGKDKVPKEWIREIIEEEISKKYPKPNEKLDKVVYKWLDNYFGGSQIYKNEYWKHHGFAFEFCKNGREIAKLTVLFNDRSPDFGPKDERPLSERSFEDSKLTIFSVMLDELLTDIPVRRNYLIYLIEEWFEDTYLDNVQGMLDRTDLHLETVMISDWKKQGEICVPPIAKSDDVTMQDMMDFIKDRTLFTYDDMLEYEKYEPGWVEKLYLDKLRDEEKERIKGEN